MLERKLRKTNYRIERENYQACVLNITVVKKIHYKNKIHCKIYIHTRGFVEFTSVYILFRSILKVRVTLFIRASVYFVWANLLRTSPVIEEQIKNCKA